MEERKKKSRTSSEVKDRYNSKTYQPHNFRIRRDSELNRKVEMFKKENPQGWNKLVTTLLENFFKEN